MKYIQKQPELQDFVEWKSSFPEWNDGRTPNYGDLQNPLKNQVKLALVNEQGKICCYCGMRIDMRNTHIEHLKPQQQCTPEETVDYHNVAASCEGENKQVHCGHNKHNWFEEALFVSPLQADCEQHFTFTYDGRIRPSRDPELVHKSAAMISRLGLDSEKLNALRSAVLEDILYSEELSLEKIDKELQLCNTPNEYGELPEYASALQYVLQLERTRL